MRRVLPHPLRRPAARLAVALALCTAIGLGLRLALLIGAHWRCDYDEAMVGLQVLRILRGARPVFHPGQPYLAALESYLIAPLFAAFGANAVTLKIVPWLLSGVYIASVGALGRRAFDNRTAALSALLAACAPTYLLVVGIKTWGATAETLALGTLCLLCASDALDPRRPARTRERTAVGLGLLAGVGFWVSWLILFYAVPIALVFLVWGRGVLRRRGAHLVLAFLVGSAPLWAYNLRHDFATFYYLLSSQGDTWANLGRVAAHLNNDLAPRLLSGDPAWRLLSWDAVWWLQIVYEGGLLALVILAWRCPPRDPRRAARALLGLFALGVPLLYLVSGYGNHALNEFGFDATGRYVLMLHAVLPIGAAALVVRLADWRRGLRFPAAAIAASVISLNLLGAARIDPVQVFVSPYYTRQPATLDPLIEYLDQQGIRHVWTDVGIAQVLMFETHERILAADWYDIYGAKGLLRFPEVPAAIQQAGRVAFVEVTLPGQENTPFEQAFRASGVPYTLARVPPNLLVIIPQAPLDPAVLGDGLGYQF